jgi:type IX secretion system PorP/SprF family membrane protein
MMKKLQVAILIAVSALGSYAQQIPMYSNYFYKPFVYNPAMAGDKEMTEIMISNRSMFSNFQGAPVLNMGTADGVLQKNKGYAGVLVANQQKGFLNNTHAFGAYAYRANFAEDIYLKLGLSLGVIDQSVNYAKMQVQNYSDPYLFVSAQHKTSLDANAGFSFYVKGLTVGFAMPQLLGSKLNYNDNASTRAFYQQSRHFMGSLQYEIAVNKEKEMYVMPYGLVRFVSGAPLQYDGGVIFNWKDKFWVGGTYKSDYAVGINAGVTLNRRFSVGYSYDYMIGNIAKYAGTSHEIMLAFKIGKLKPKPGEDTLTPQDKKIIELQKQIDELKKNGVKASEPKTTTTNTTSTSGGNEPKSSKFQGKNAVKENGVFVLTNKASDWTYSTGTPAKKGYYVVVESVFYKDYATQEVKRYTSFGFPDADFLFEKTTKFHYVYVHYTTSKEDAMQKVADTKLAGVPDVWIQVLIE